jgi:hypothetical protein
MAHLLFSRGQASRTRVLSRAGRDERPMCNLLQSFAATVEGHFSRSPSFVTFSRLGSSLG